MCDKHTALQVQIANMRRLLRTLYRATDSGQVAKLDAGVICPWWAIVRPALCGKILKAGPFFSEAAAQSHMNAYPEVYYRCQVQIYSGQSSPQYREVTEIIRAGWRLASEK